MSDPQQPTTSTVEVRRLVVGFLPQPDNAAFPPIPMQVRLTFDDAEPYGILAEFRAGADRWVSWWISRALLTEGLGCQAGGHDVTIQPEGDDYLRVRLVAGTAATFLFARLPVAEFLDRTYAIAPAADELAGLDWDAGLALLLADPNGQDEEST